MARRIETVTATHPWLVLERGESVVGYAYAGEHRQRAAYRWAADVSVYVDAAQRRSGVARTLYGALFELLREQGLRIACAGITLPNQASVALHESLGFERVGVFRGIGWKAGQWRDVGWWQLDLAPRGAGSPAEPLCSITRPIAPRRTKTKTTAAAPYARLVSRRSVPVVLSIAGSDSGGGAGIQADLKAFARAGVHGTTAITAITVQNTIAVSAVQAIDPEIIAGQVRAVAEDLGVDAVKIGMLADTTTIKTVAAALEELPRGTPVVHDPVMVAESGARLLEPAAIDALRELILPRATVITPNLAEARALAGGDGTLDGEPLARALHALGAGAVVITGGHRDAATDLFYDGAALTELPGERHPDGAAHGSGCTHSSTLAARLALGDDPLTAARTARAVAGAAIAAGLRDLGAGAGPVDVFGLSRAHSA
jgi:hydroxymethylpyrimidine/phosphomethylpyrimidine kinase